MEKRFLNLKEATEYLNMSENSTKSFCQKIGAICRPEGIKRILIDRVKVDSYFDKVADRKQLI